MRGEKPADQGRDGKGRCGDALASSRTSASSCLRQAGRKGESEGALRPCLAKGTAKGTPINLRAPGIHPVISAGDGRWFYRRCFRTCQRERGKLALPVLPLSRADRQCPVVTPRGPVPRRQQRGQDERLAAPTGTLPRKDLVSWIAGAEAPIKKTLWQRKLVSGPCRVSPVCKQEDLARRCLEKGNTAACLLRLGDVLAGKKDWEQAVQRYDQAWQKDRQDPLPLYLSGKALVGPGESGKATSSCGRPSGCRWATR